LIHLAPIELDHARLGPWRVAVLRLREIPQTDEAEDVGLDLRLRDLLSRRGVGAGAAVSRERGELGDRALEPRRLGQPAAFEPEHGHRDLPAVPGLTDEVAILDFDSREEDLAELAATGHLLDPPHLDTGLLHVDQEKADPAVRLGRAIGTGQQEAPVRVMS